jgi:multidrug efflux pump subunit AcrA (membrane-fusion protein)
MKRHHFSLTISCIALAAVLIGCGKKHEEETKQTKHEENIVTLSKESLEHVELKTEPAGISNLETTLKAAGRVTENANKTAKVTSTLEGRLIKLNFDINDHVKVGDVLALVQTPELLGKPLELRSPIVNPLPVNWSVRRRRFTPSAIQSTSG